MPIAFHMKYKESMYDVDLVQTHTRCQSMQYWYFGNEGWYCILSASSSCRLPPFLLDFLDSCFFSFLGRISSCVLCSMIGTKLAAVIMEL